MSLNELPLHASREGAGGWVNKYLYLTNIKLPNAYSVLKK